MCCAHSQANVVQGRRVPLGLGGAAVCEGGGASRLSALPHRFGLTSPTAIHRHSHYMDHSPVSPSTRAEVCPAARLRSLRGHQKWFWPDRPLLALTFGATFSSSGEKSHCGGEALAVFAELVVTGGPGVMPFATPPLCPGSPFVLTLELKGRFFLPLCAAERSWCSQAEYRAIRFKKNSDLCEDGDAFNAGLL